MFKSITILLEDNYNFFIIYTFLHCTLFVNIPERATFAALLNMTLGNHRVKVTSVSLELLELSLITSSSLLDNDECRENL